ncbi:TPA: hypothetical protein ACH3X2_14255 [Trebouxia sp. C0005]
MKRLSATGLSEAGSASELSDRASEPHGKWNNASPVTALIAVTMSSCSGLDKQVQSVEGCWLSSDAKLACTWRTACLAMSTGMSTSSAHKHMAEDTAVSGRSRGTNKGTAGSMGVSAGIGPEARAGSATVAGTAEVDGPSVACIETATGVGREPGLN